MSNENEHTKKNLAVYIDGDNASYKEFQYIHEEIKTYGRIIIGRIYGDWTKSEMKGWKDISINYALEPINCFNLSKKNSTDIKLICDVLRDLYNNNQIDSFIIVSSDSDYTNVTSRIKSEGKTVIGVGRQNTPIMLKNSCDIFITTDNLNKKIKDDDDDESPTDDTMYGLNSTYIGEDDFLRNIYKSFQGGYRIRFKKLLIFLKKLVNLNSIIGKEKLENFIKKNYSEYFMFIEKKKELFILDITNIKKIVKGIFERSTKKEVNLSLIKDTLLLNDAAFDHRNYGFTKMIEFVEVVLKDEIEIINLDHGKTYVKEK